MARQKNALAQALHAIKYNRTHIIFSQLFIDTHAVRLHAPRTIGNMKDRAELLRFPLFN